MCLLCNACTGHIGGFIKELVTWWIGAFMSMQTWIRSLTGVAI